MRRELNYPKINTLSNAFTHYLLVSFSITFTFPRNLFTLSELFMETKIPALSGIEIKNFIGFSPMGGAECFYNYGIDKKGNTVIRKGNVTLIRD